MHQTPTKVKVRRDIKLERPTEKFDVKVIDFMQFFKRALLENEETSVH